MDDDVIMSASTISKPTNVERIMHVEIDKSHPLGFKATNKYFKKTYHLYIYKGLTPDLSKMLIECKFSQEELEKNKGKILEALILCKEGIRFESLPPEKTV